VKFAAYDVACQVMLVVMFRLLGCVFIGFHCDVNCVAEMQLNWVIVDAFR
jgi:hypothetical protein